MISMPERSGCGCFISGAAKRRTLCDKGLNCNAAVRKRETKGRARRGDAESLLIGTALAVQPGCGGSAPDGDPVKRAWKGKKVQEERKAGL